LFYYANLYQVEKRKNLGDYNKEMTFFSANTNNKISRLSKNEKIKKQAGNSLAHLSFRSTGKTLK